VFCFVKEKGVNKKVCEVENENRDEDREVLDESDFGVISLVLPLLRFGECFVGLYIVSLAPTGWVCVLKSNII